MREQYVDVLNEYRVRPTLSPKIPLMRPLLPTLEAIAPYLQEIDERRWYTNFGPLVARLEERLAAHFSVPFGNAALVANGTTALSAALIASGAKPGSECLLPSWTFVASASAVCAANLVPHFIDVGADTWEPDPEVIRRRGDLAKVGAVMVVSPFGAPVDARAWDAFCSETGIPVIIDAAASFDTVATQPPARVGRSPVMISLHATKPFGIGEGGLILSTDDDIVHRVRQVCNFGIWGSPHGQVLGYNGKVSEYHCAVGLAALDAWPERRAALLSVTQLYVDELSRLRHASRTPDYGAGWVSAYCTVRVDADVALIIERMAALGIETRQWWQSGVHSQVAYRQFPRDDLPNTERIAAQALSLPFSHDMTPEQVCEVVRGLEVSIDASRLR